jgi:hypothetical protein
MNWYKRHKLSQVRGEYWISSEGITMFADAEIGDYNHEAYIIEMVQHEFNDDDRLSWDQFKQKIAQEKFQEKMNETQDPQQKQMLQQEWQNNIDIFVEEGLKELTMTNEQINIADGQGDAKTYGMKNMGWKRLQGHNIETWTLTNQDLKAIANGLFDAYDESVENETFNIYVFATQKWYTDVPWAAIESENVMSIVQYRETQYSG